MPKFTMLDGQTLVYGKEGAYTVDDEKAFILSLDKQLRAVDLNDKRQVSVVQNNLNIISKTLQLESLPTDGALDQPTIQAIQYFKQNSDLFKEHGISQHIDAKKLEKLTNPAFTETEHAPTMDEMKALEIDIGALYE